jgi:hypothetical protein
MPNLHVWLIKKKSAGHLKLRTGLPNSVRG